MIKELFISLACVLISMNAIAQSRVSWEAQAGLNVSKFTSGATNPILGFHAGIREEVSFSRLYNGLYANGGLFLSSKGANSDVKGIKVTICYLDVPIHLGYKHAITDAFAIFGEFGPYLAYGLSGRLIEKYEGERYSENLFNVEDKEEGIKRFDCGLGLRTGFEFSKKYTCSIGYDFGIANFSDDYEYVINNCNLAITIGYKF